jgi:chemotaxis protein methyltransferase CheR
MHAKKLDSFDSLVEQVCKRITVLTGNVFGDRQMPMVHARFNRHLREINISVDDYPKYWKANQQQEDDALVALLTTHFTAFFREFLHFEWLASELPQVIDRIRTEGRSELRLWSAACSRGQEVWSLAMWLQYYMPRIAPDLKWSIHGSDIDSVSVKCAINGVYHYRELQTAPRYLWESHWQRGTGDISDWLKVKKGLRDHCSFSTDNLLSLAMTDSKKFDFIFCRNVLIYFDTQNQIKAVNGLLKHLYPAGALITGVSESLVNLGLGLISHAPSVYSRQAEVKQVQVKPQTKAVAIPKPLKVLCIDDSGTVLNIFKKLLNNSDFEIIGTAMNGAEALDKISTLKPDIITLDLHMPIMDGFTLIKDHGVAKKFPVVVVSTVERENAGIVQPLFQEGVCDFLEKPSFENLGRIGDELQQKLKMAWWSKVRGEFLNTQTPSTTKSKRLSGRLVLNAGLPDREAVQWLLRNSDLKNDEIIIHMNGVKHLWEDWALELKSEFLDLKLTIKESAEWVRDGRHTLFLHFVGGSILNIDYASSQGASIVLEDSDWPESVRSKSIDAYPVTSFAYMVDKVLEGK